MDRKEMVKKLGEFFGVKPRYLNVPTFAYEIETENETYTIDRQGTITKSDGKKITFDEITNPAPKLKKEPTYLESAEVILPLDGHTGVSLKNLVNMIYSKQHLLELAFKTDLILIDESFPIELAQREPISVEDFKKILDELGTDRLFGLKIDFENQLITIKLEAPNLDEDKIAAFRELTTFINQNAKKQKRVSFKRAQDDNPKYALRTWLIRLGMNGPEYKTTRKVLMQNLEGSGAFRKVGEPNE